MVGLISLHASPYTIAKQAISDATYMCERVHGDAPEVIVHGRPDLTFPYVSSHLHYMLLELLKNSMRATMETHKDRAHLPPIRIVIADGEDNEDVSSFVFSFALLSFDRPHSLCVLTADCRW